MFAPNPFSPGKRLTRPELFSGRKKQLRTAVQVLAQAGAGNARHALITGDRGIGKSSFSSQLQGIARGEGKYLQLVDADSGDLPYSYLVVEHISQVGEGPMEIAAGLLRELEKTKGLSRFLKYNLEFSVDFGPFSTSAKPKDVEVRDAVVRFVDEVQKVADGARGKVDALVLVVDEVDRVALNPGVSTFFKVATELLSSRGLENVAFLLVGMVGTLEALKQEHPSVGRIFKPVVVPLLEDDEGRELVAKALHDTDVSIEERANELLISYSGGYPNSVHLVGEAAYDLALEDGNVITEATVEEAVAQVVQGPAREEYDPQYLKFRGRSANILRFMAMQGDRDVNSDAILGELNVRATQVSNNFDSLLRADVLVRPRPGVYRIREPLYREYLRYIVQSGDEPVQRRPEKRTSGRRTRRDEEES